MNTRLKYFFWLGGILILLIVLWWGFTTFNGFRSEALPPAPRESPKLEELVSLLDLPVFQTIAPQAPLVTSTPPLGRGNPFVPPSP